MAAEFLTRLLLRGPLPVRLARYAARTERTALGAGRFLAAVAVADSPAPDDLVYPLAPPVPWHDTRLLAPGVARMYEARCPRWGARRVLTEAALVDFGMRLCRSGRARDPELLSSSARAAESRSRVASIVRSE